MPIRDLRRDYGGRELNEATVHSDPIVQLQLWLDEAIAAGERDANAMTLATADAKGRPSARVVLLRGLDRDGLTFFTNYDSRKGEDLAQNPVAATTFFWPLLERQVRVEGDIQTVPTSESDDYFRSRPREAQLSAWVSKQSAVITGGREELEVLYSKMERQFADQEIPRPAFWGGYRLKPDRIEFWQGRAGRLHDRLCFTAIDRKWQINRLGP